jgi:hypothetical protein
VNGKSTGTPCGARAARTPRFDPIGLLLSSLLANLASYTLGAVFSILGVR